MGSCRTIVLLAGVSTLPLPAAAETLVFNGTVLASCALTSPTPGTLTQTPTLTGWTTVTPATIVATNTGPSTLSITGPTGWTDSPAKTPSTTFTTSAAITGTNSVASITDAALASIGLPLVGVNTLSVSLSATAATIFPAGTYKAQVTVTCASP